jgi:hypothetical protein
VETEPTRAAFGLPERSLIPDYKLGPVNAAIKKKLDSWQFDLNDVSPQVRDDVHYQVGRFLTEIMETTDSRWKCAARSLGLEDDFIQLLTEERRYQVAREDWKSYQDWKRNRNPERAAMEEKFGFDGKHGSHVVRLYRQGFELMLTGKVTVWRGGLDAEELLSIRKGAWSYEDLMAFTESMETKLHEVYTSGTCPLPYRPDYDALSDLAVRVWSVAQ